jgi:hypothetical protein
MQQNSDYDRIETAANVEVKINETDGNKYTIPVSELDMTKEVDIEKVRESGLYPDGYAINAIDVEGSLTFAGAKIRSGPGQSINSLEEVFYKGDGTPETFDVTIVHTLPKDQNSENPTTTIKRCMLTTREYSVSSEEATETSVDFIAQRIVNSFF